MATKQLVTAISYLQTVPEDEKPYHLMYGDFEGLPRTNISREWRNTTFVDVRTRLPELSFNKSGFTVRRLQSRMTYQDFDDDQKVWDVYFKELESHLREFLGAHEVKFFRYGIRKRHSDFPISTGKEYEFAQPTSIAHVDATLDSTKQEMTKQFGDRAPDLMSRRFQWINVWKPLRGPNNDWPLCLCDASTLDSHDAHPTDMVYPEYFTENLSLRFNPAQRWFFLSDHGADEIVIFKQSDSDPAAACGVPHCSFENPSSAQNGIPRESIEARALVVY